MSNRIILFCIIGVLFIIGILVALNFKFELKDSNNYNENFNFKSKEFKGLFIFDQLLVESFGEKNIARLNYLKDFSKIDSNALYLNIGESVNIGDKNSTLFYDYLSNGGKALIISNDINIYLDGFDNDTLHEDLESEIIDSLQSGIDEIAPLDTSYYQNDTDSSYSETDSTASQKYKEMDYLDSIEQIKSDSLHDIWIERTGVSDTIYSYSGETFSFKKLFKKDICDTFYVTPNAYNGLSGEEIIKSKKGIAIFKKYSIGKGILYVHQVPDMFFNYAAKQPFYLNHFNKVVKEMGAEKLVINRHLSTFGEQEESPLKYMLENKSLAFAYYMLIASFILYLLFNAKRKQKAIPLVSSPKNTSLEYVKTISRLFQIQDHNLSLVKKIRDNFFISVKKNYYLEENDKDFAIILSKKSKVNIETVEEILKFFKTMDVTLRCDDDDLNKIYLLIENFKFKT
jgi:hypothetical protein